ncbi:MAG: DnaK suppressor protein [Myxococcota bacterium]|jgi:DnaK suppressor protein
MTTRDPLTDDERTELRADLDTLRVSLSRLLKDESGLANTVELDQSRMGRISRIDAIQQQKMAQATLRRHQQRLDRVEAAVERYDEDPDEYGPCMRCGEAIGYRRLKAFPDVVVCIGCSRA